MSRIWHFLDDWGDAVNWPSGLKQRLSQILIEDELISFLLDTWESNNSDGTPIRVLPWFYWNNRSDLVRRFLSEFVRRYCLADVSPTICYRLLRLQEMAGSEALLTPDILMQMERKLGASASPIYQNILERLRFGIALRRSAITVPSVSLGQDCLPWDLLNRWHLRSEADLARLEGPFDLAAHAPDALRRLLATDFHDYADPSSFMVVATATGARMAVFRPRSAFNHHLSEYWLANDCRELVGFLDSRVRTLRAGFSDTSLFYVYHAKTITAPQQAAELVTDISAFTTLGNVLSRKPMVIMNTDPMLVHVAEQVSDFCMFLSIPRPSSEYIWYHDEHYSSEEGHAFERRVVDAILAVREQLS